METITIQVSTLREACEKINYYQRKVYEIREKRDEMLLKTDYLLLPDSKISTDELKLSKVKEYRQELRDFMNKLMNDDIQCDMFLQIDEFIATYFPKLDM